MTEAEVLVLHGSPGSGKTTLARELSELLREADTPHGVIDVDELSLVHPHPGQDFWLANLRAVWPNYAAAASGLKLLLPTVVADEAALELLRAALPGATLQVCELTAPVDVLKERVTAREPNEFWRANLRRWVDHHHRRTDLERVRDFTVSTHDRPVADAAREVLRKAGWV